MKNVTAAGLLGLLVVVLALSAFPRLRAQEDSGLQIAEYATIRWDGPGNTHLIRASGKVEMLGPLLTRLPRPGGADERAYYMNAAMNIVAREGYEFAGMTSDEIVMKRAKNR